MQSFITNCPILMGTATSMQTCHRIGPFSHPTLSHHEPCASLSLWLLSECLHDPLFLAAPDPEELQESIGCISLSDIGEVRRREYFGQYNQSETKCLLPNKNQLPLLIPRTNIHFPHKDLEQIQTLATSTQRRSILQSL